MIRMLEMLSQKLMSIVPRHVSTLVITNVMTVKIPRFTCLLSVTCTRDFIIMLCRGIQTCYLKCFVMYQLRSAGSTALYLL